MEGKKLGTFPKFNRQSFAKICRELSHMGLLPIDFKSKIGPQSSGLTSCTESKYVNEEGTSWI
jgi:hypothetical protein